MKKIRKNELTEESLISIGFVAERGEWGDGALELFNNPKDMESLLIWIPGEKATNGLYIYNDLEMIKTEVKTAKDIKILFKLLTGKKFNDVWKTTKS